MTMAIRKTYCRHCTSLCGLEVEVDDNRILAIRGDRDHPTSKGYSCAMGQHSLTLHDSPDRLTMAHRRMPHGAFEPMAPLAAVEAAGRELRRILDTHGPRSIATYYGTGTAYSGAAYSMAKAWLRGLGSEEIYSSMTVDQSSWYVCAARMGIFGTGKPFFEDSDCVLSLGVNPVISHQGWPQGPVHVSAPTASLASARKQGIAMIVVDPRRTETAARATLHLQVRPGEDATLLAAIINQLFEHDWIDWGFCDRWVVNVEQMREAVRDFGLDHAARCTGVPAADIAEAARLFGTARKATAFRGTGLAFNRDSNLNEHLMEALCVLRGGYRRTGEPLRTTGGLFGHPLHEHVIPPHRTWDGGDRMRGVDAGRIGEEFPSSQLPGEILQGGGERIRALVVVGGNPATAISGTRKTVEALKALDLLVTIDPRWSHTARLSHYVIPTKLPFERTDINIPLDMYVPADVVDYTEPVIDPPAGVMDDWEVFWELARVMGTRLHLRPSPFGSTPKAGLWLDMDRKPTTEDIFRAMCSTSRVDFDVLRHARQWTAIATPAPTLVQDAPGDDGHRLDLCAEDVFEEIRDVRTRPSAVSADFPLSLVSRRLKRVMNTVHHDQDSVRALYELAPVYLHPDDMHQLNLVERERVRVVSRHGFAVGEARSDATLKPGVVAMPMGWGSADPDDPESGLTGRLISIEEDLQKFNFMPLQTGIAVRLERIN